MKLGPAVRAWLIWSLVFINNGSHASERQDIFHWNQTFNPLEYYCLRTYPHGLTDQVGGLLLLFYYSLFLKNSTVGSKQRFMGSCSIV